MPDQKYSNSRMKRGLCVECGKFPRDGKHVSCRSCLDRKKLHYYGGMPQWKFVVEKYLGMKPQKYRTSL